jgi:hypothetical protein
VKMLSQAGLGRRKRPDIINIQDRLNIVFGHGCTGWYL